MIYSKTFHPFLSLTPEEQAKRIECDRITAEHSTYWSCCCGLYHVSGCKVRRTNWAVNVLCGLVISTVAYWIWSAN